MLINVCVQHIIFCTNAPEWGQTTLNEEQNTCRVLIKTGNKYTIDTKRLTIRSQVITDISPACKSDDMFPGYVFIPPFCNIHAHLGESIYRNITGDQWTLHKYLEFTNKCNDEMSKEKQQTTWEQSANLTIEEMHNQGITLFCAGRSASPAKQYNELSMAGYPIMNNNKIISYKQQGLPGFIRYKDENQSNRISIGVFLHSLYANDSISLNLARECMHCGADFITVHVSEDEESRKLEEKKFGTSPIIVLQQNGLLTDKTILVHCGYTDDEDLRIIADSGAIIAICPISNSFLHTKSPNIRLLEERGIKWCIATDGWATGRTLSLIEQVKHIHKKYPEISCEKFFESITCVPGMLFQRSIYTGSIENNAESRLIKVKYNGDSAQTLLDLLINSHLETRLVSLKGIHG